MSRYGYGHGYGCTAAARRRPRPRMTHRVGPNPDRIAAWAVVLGVALVLAALLSAH
jgi:hypothetical protein